MCMRILLTGAAGGIGSRLRRLLPPLYDLVLTDREPPSDLRPEETFIAADLADASAIEHAATGVDGILHFGGQAVEAPWETILNSNIVGTYNLFEIARKQKVRRVVFASTNHVVGFYPRSQTIGPQVLPLPDFALRRQQGIWRGARRALRPQIWAERFLYPHRQRVGLPRRRAATRHMA